MGKDTVYGGQGNDTIWGGEGNDDDTLIGDDGFDTIYGEAGNDWLSGGYEWGPDGNSEDKLWGGPGADVFAYQTYKVVATQEPTYFLFWQLTRELKQVQGEAMDYSAGDSEFGSSLQT